MRFAGSTQRILDWARRRWIALAVIAAVMIVAGMGYLGYMTSRPEVIIPITAPPTVTVDRGEVVLSVTAPGQLVGAGENTLLSEVSGRVEEMLVQAGDAVKKGQALARLGARTTFEIALADAQVAVLEAQAELDQTTPEALLAQAKADLALAEKEHTDAQNKRSSQSYARTTTEWLDIARSDYYMAENALEQAEDFYSGFSGMAESDPSRAQALSQVANARLKRDQKLANLNWLLSKPSDQEVAEADAGLETARIKLDEARRKVERMQSGQYPEHQLAEAKLKKAQAVLAEAQKDLESLEVKAPFDCVVIEVLAAAGQPVNDGGELLKIIDPHNLEAQVTVVEEDLPLVKPGQAVQLYFDAIPDAEVQGKISRIIPIRAAGDRAVYTLYVSLDQVPPELASGMTVDGSIVIDSRADVLRLPRAVVRARSDGTADVKVWNGLASEDRTVSVGMKGDSFIEILDGLQEGEQVVAR